HSGDRHTWVISVPVKLASIPANYPRFAVECSVSSAVRPSGSPYFPSTVDLVGSGKQEWPLDSNGAFSGSMAVKVFLKHGFNTGRATGGSSWGRLWLLEANSVANRAGRGEEQSLRPKGGTPFGGEISAKVPWRLTCEAAAVTADAHAGPRSPPPRT